MVGTGSVTGAVVGYLGNTFASGHKEAIVASLFGWMILCCYVRGSVKELDYPATVASLTAGKHVCEVTTTTTTTKI